MYKFIFSLMCFFTLVGVNLHAEEQNSENTKKLGDVIKTMPYKLSETGRISDVSNTANSSAFLVTPPPDSFILRNSLHIADPNSRELPLKVIGKLHIETLGSQRQLIVKDPFRILVDLKNRNKSPKFLTLKFTACKAENLCFSPMSLKVMLND